jgi:hypothetical protein
VEDQFPKFRFVLVRNPNHDSLVVRWALAPTLYPLEQITFEVFRSNGPNGPWEHVGDAEDGAFHFVDFDITNLTSYKLYYYIVRAADKTGAGYWDSSHAVLEHDPDNVALGLIRKKNVYLRARGGVPMAALLRKRWGAKCGRCWDKVRKLSADADCPLCYGTGYAGGFLAPVFMPGMQPQASSKMYQLLGDAKYQTDQTVFELSNYPYLSPDDVLIDRVMNHRYRINRVEQHTHRGHIVSQLAVATMEDENSVLYSIKLPEHKPTIIGKSFDLAKP